LNEVTILTFWIQVRKVKIYQNSIVNNEEIRFSKDKKEKKYMLNVDEKTIKLSDDVKFCFLKKGKVCMIFDY
jgi:hypothetical protein